ncbi:MAG: EboA domain-containing protein [Sulfuricellaceae bacterium]
MSNKPDISSLLEPLLHRLAPACLSENFVIEEFGRRFSSLGWSLRSVNLALSSDEHAALIAAGILNPEALDVSGIARIHLLIQALQLLPTGEHAAFIDACFRSGDNLEREALLRALMLLPLPERFISTTLDACRVAVQTTFEAIACENAYPATYFGTDAFCAMVLKALHLGVSVRRICGLAARCDSNLKRMAAAFGSELTAAGKTTTPDISYILDLEETTT